MSSEKWYKRAYISAREADIADLRSKNDNEDQLKIIKIKFSKANCLRKLMHSNYKMLQKWMSVIYYYYRLPSP